VACDLAKIDVEIKVTINHASGKYYYDGYGGVMPISVQNWLGIVTESPTVNGVSLIKINDKGVGFSEIANFIEEEWLDEENPEGYDILLRVVEEETAAIL
jgi:hypothetical protein